MPSDSNSLPQDRGHRSGVRTSKRDTLKDLSAMSDEALKDMFLGGHVRTITHWAGPHRGMMVKRSQASMAMFALMKIAETFFWKGKTFRFDGEIDRPETDSPYAIGHGNNRGTSFGIGDFGMLGFDICLAKSRIDREDSMVLKGRTIANSWFHDEARIVTYEGIEFLLGFVDLADISGEDAPSVWWLLYDDEE